MRLLFSVSRPIARAAVGGRQIGGRVFLLHVLHPLHGLYANVRPVALGEAGQSDRRRRGQPTRATWRIALRG